MLRDWRRAEGSRGRALSAPTSFKVTRPTRNRAQHIGNRRRKAFPFASFSFHFPPRFGTYQGVRPRESENSFFRVLPFAIFGPLPKDRRRAGSLDGHGAGRPHMLWLEGFEAIAFPGADSIISILCGAISRRPLFPPVLILRPFAVRQRASKDAPRRLASPSRRPLRGLLTWCGRVKRHPKLTPWRHEELTPSAIVEPLAHPQDRLGSRAGRPAPLRG